MRLSVHHTTRYFFDQPVRYGVQQLRKTPKNARHQHVVEWRTSIVGGRKEATFEDHHHNLTELISIDPDIQTLELVWVQSPHVMSLYLQLKVSAIQILIRQIYRVVCIRGQCPRFLLHFQQVF